MTLNRRTFLGTTAAASAALAAPMVLADGHARPRVVVVGGGQAQMAPSKAAKVSSCPKDAKVGHQPASQRWLTVVLENARNACFEA